MTKFAYVSELNIYLGYFNFFLKLNISLEAQPSSWKDRELVAEFQGQFRVVWLLEDRETDSINFVAKGQVSESFLG